MTVFFVPINRAFGRIHPSWKEIFEISAKDQLLQSPFSCQMLPRQKASLNHGSDIKL